ncbi:MAG: hypothetical protein AAGF28_11980 [Pseudomonadota bacterium]
MNSENELESFYALSATANGEQVEGNKVVGEVNTGKRLQTVTDGNVELKRAESNTATAFYNSMKKLINSASFQKVDK